MRDPNRIEKITEVLATYWRYYPDLRLGQLLSNLGIHRLTEDDVTLEQLQININEAEARLSPPDEGTNG